jgi:dipeptidyl aminopeptidase/acylaminoacyl peptidase
VVLPHGGPHGIRDYWGFDWEVQLLANRGYGVLQVNYRGSAGFGLDFEQSGHGKWGTMMQDDLTDATKALIESGVADGNRVCIYGHSYGGFAALMGAVREPELYRCAIGSMGVYDLPLMFEKGDIADRASGLAYLRQALGEDEIDLKNRSPAFNADKIKANILLIHGARDKRAPIEQAESMQAALMKAGVSFEWLEIGDEAHGYYDEANRLAVYNKVLGFLEANIGR